MFGSTPAKKAITLPVSPATGRFRRARRGNPKRFRRLLNEPLESRQLLSTLLITSTNDGGTGSLRAAILDAAPGDTIQFASSLAGQTIKLTSDILTISKRVTIQQFPAVS